ncbi:MAG TPA: hypothetical protein VKJ47_23140 [Candidatus Binatia bacterium]|nr:hypothetical protein [Candidatus Binatia bacterium]
MMIDRDYPKFDCARVRRPFTCESAYSRRRGDYCMHTKPFKVNRRFERFELLEMCEPQTLQILIERGYLEIYPKPQP